MRRLDIIGYNFRRLRELNGWTQEQLAEISGVTPGYIGQIEAALLKSFGARAEERWANFFKIAIYELFLPPTPDASQEREWNVIRDEAMKRGPRYIETLKRLMAVYTESEGAHEYNQLPEQKKPEEKRKGEKAG